MAKKNPFLEAFEAKLEAQYQLRLARRVKQVLGEEDWERFKELFPLLREYW